MAHRLHSEPRITPGLLIIMMNDEASLHGQPAKGLLFEGFPSAGHLAGGFGTVQDAKPRQWQLG